MSTYVTIALMFALLVEALLAGWGAAWWMRERAKCAALLGQRGLAWIAVALLGLCLATVLSERATFAAEGLLKTAVLMTVFRSAFALAALPAAITTDLALRQPPPKLFRRPVPTILVAAMGTLLGSHAIVFALSQFVPVEAQGMLDEVTRSAAGIGAICALALVAAAWEEILYRGALQGVLEVACVRAGKSPMIAVVAQAAIFAVAHAGMLSPPGVKELQIFFVAIVWGLVRRWHGLGASIATHILFNASSAGAAALVLAWKLWPAAM
ncbi:MAG: CPBP family intramembrane glutamic endopeptidase [Sumerlaeia bacterium]